MLLEKVDTCKICMLGFIQVEIAGCHGNLLIFSKVVQEPASSGQHWVVCRWLWHQRHQTGRR